jgi:hypothetical protein
MTPSHSNTVQTLVPEQMPPSSRARSPAPESAKALLTDRFADDTQTVDEFEARLERLNAARTSEELDAVMRDLVDVRRADSRPSAPAGMGAYAAPAAYDPMAARAPAAPRDGRVYAILSNAQRTGRWVVPGFLDVDVVMGDVMIDLREASLPMGDCEIAVFAFMGAAKVLVPPGVFVDEAVSSFMGTVRNDAADDARQAPGTARVRLTGTAVMAEINVRVAPPGEAPGRAWRQAKRRSRR